MKKYKGLLFLLICAVTAGAIVSCNKDFARVIPDNDYQDTANVQYGKRKVLYLIVDGARGQSVNAANTPNIKSLVSTSIYSWVSLSDPDSTADISNWAAMLTGVKKEKHKVLTNDLSGNNLETYKLVFQHIKELKPEEKIVSFSSSALFKNSLTAGTDDSESFATDAEVKDAVINDLNTDTASMVVGHFTAVDKAGATYGYDNSFAQYKSAIETFDGYVGEIVNALKARTEYQNEEWLVVVASSGGGKFTIPVNENDNTVFSKTAANTFVVYNTFKYKPRIITKPFTGNRYIGKTVRMLNDQVHAQIDTADVFNLSDTLEFTIELKVKKNADQFFWPSVLGKRGEWSGGHPNVGWVIYLEDKYWYFEMRGKNDLGGNFRQCRGADLPRGQWQNLSVKCEIRGGRRYIITFTNGVRNNEMDITDAGTLDNNYPLVLGYMNGNGHGSPDVYLSDVRFFKTDLPDATIANYACETNIDESHPYYSFLAGYWPCTEGEGDHFIDYGPQARDFKLTGNYAWEDFNDLICPPSADALAVFVPQTVDIPSQILNWFRIASKQSWGLDGRVWLDQ